ncbi:MAG: hypothetical protein A3I07_02410 [Candidatus Doudnabacteria bacterium RIFCSPLOWO2_02_FULL_42_9]|uniref:DHHA1 domain-containing protein n=1 Tax=Candidatus Doudnabacteria bacterium RIFCSPHIGHO2_01_FULL_41_86 TaxID=1817821 RepID=A0A1F5N7K3_9BACT|nr:MAG: hypothetical protein A2717_03120 [Candidatus Doudnabacteria bacterium RIFCSPHIGHO2_01_FULL_41_86]OGE74686.1 MAG: hypothetical protein A3K07_02715 [Candidatus Doudnabacteria bacterium RIFCSPHIGHO2_01_43_10]OGE85045.1 MAG: hypothetical protein A3E28_04525 [Candidatus Doudnabacteria bacterium RIFCSPHIGHO2_12_FULL_42_22]OGE86486.1 MAG: hypothetical protein A3C49_04705 [Candidatus Doudnabacteria bacterium RIFCSPHIGHO2_02_FULL_42_25]OGE91948.1 MAG: hypothetical protein A2895_01470 [Candidatus
MEPLQQIISKISSSQSILVIGNGSNGDSLAAALALRSFLKKLEKDSVLLIPYSVTDRFHFLPEIAEVVSEIDLTKSFVIDVSTKKSQVAELSYKKESDKLSIFLKPQKGEFTPTDVTFRSSNFPYDLVVLIGIPSLDSLGEFYGKHAELFFDVPVVNIDFRGNNENYGQFNLVQLNSTSCSEIVLDLINKFEATLIDETIATQLLAGIIAETNSFQHVRTTPQTFMKASQLISLGAKQQEIISHLYKTKSLGFLKLWGRVLARLKQETELGLAYSTLMKTDIVKSEADEKDVELIIKEMASQLGFAKLFMFLSETEENTVNVYFHSSLALNFQSLFGAYQPQSIGPQSVKFTIRSSLVDAEKQVIDSLKSEINRLKPVL